MSDKNAKVQEAIKERIAELKDAQYKRASVIEKSLIAYEKSIRIRSVNDYIALSAHQRRLMGIVDNKSETKVTGTVEIKLISYKDAN